MSGYDKYWKDAPEDAEGLDCAWGYWLKIKHGEVFEIKVGTNNHWMRSSLDFNHNAVMRRPS